jgi:hypothetical protein
MARANAMRISCSAAIPPASAAPRRLAALAASCAC